MLRKRVYAGAKLQPGRECALTKQLGMQRQRRSCHQLLKQSGTRLHERRKESEAGAAIEGVRLVGLGRGGANTEHGFSSCYTSSFDMDAVGSGCPVDCR